MHSFSMVNAVLLPGGGAKLSPGHRFYDAATLLVDLAVDANENGDYFPVRPHAGGTGARGTVCPGAACAGEVCEGTPRLCV